MTTLRRRARGFTLVELLVVIAIIGILAAIVLASLGTARSKGSDAKIQEQLSSIRNAAETYYSTNHHYGAAANPAETDCAIAGMGLDTGSGFANLVNAANWPGALAPTCVNNSTISTDATEWAAWHVLSDNTTYWCVDSSGKSKSEASAPASSATACP